MNIPSLMKAARLYKKNEPLKIEKIPTPKIKEDEVLVNVKAVGLCGSDVHIVYEDVTPTAFKPITIGHESSGIIVATGSRVTHWCVGTRVAINPFITCGQCHNCLAGASEICFTRQVIGIQTDGALAEYIAIPARNLIQLPANVPFDVGAIITDAVATPYHAIVDRANLQLGETIAIYGVGGLGLHAVQIAKLCGARQIIVVDTRETQLERALQLGATQAIHPGKLNLIEAVMELTNDIGVDVAIEFIGLQTTIKETVDVVRPGGRAVIVGLGSKPIHVMPPTQFVRKQISLLGSYGFTNLSIERLAQLVASNRLNLTDSITHKFSLEEINTGLKYLHEKIENPIRVVIQFD